MLIMVFVITGINAQQMLEVIIKNVDQNRGGVVLMALFNTSESFLSKPMKTERVSVNSSQSSVFFFNLEKGEYAVSVFQDTNDNKKLDTNFIGYPKEPFGFSNDAMGAFGPPSFDKAKITVTENVQTVIILR